MFVRRDDTPSEVNILPVIAEFISTHDMHAESVSREYLINWLTGQLPTPAGTITRRNPNYSAPFQPNTVEAEIAADCLIAAGIGNEAEQQGTVFGFHSYG